MDTASTILRIHGVPGSRSRFIRGNANGDERVDISDPIWTLSRLFFRAEEIPCPDAVDFNGDARIDISDSVYLFNYIFIGGLPPPAPFPGCVGPAISGLPCEESQALCQI